MTRNQFSTSRNCSEEAAAKEWETGGPGTRKWLNSIQPEARFIRIGRRNTQHTINAKGGGRSSKVISSSLSNRYSIIEYFVKNLNICWRKERKFSVLFYKKYSLNLSRRCRRRRSTLFMRWWPRAILVRLFWFLAARDSISFVPRISNFHYYIPCVRFALFILHIVCISISHCSCWWCVLYSETLTDGQTIQWPAIQFHSVGLWLWFFSCGIKLYFIPLSLSLLHHYLKIIYPPKPCH